MPLLNGLSREDKHTIRFVQKHYKNPETVLRSMDTKGKAKNPERECMGCLRTDITRPNIFTWCSDCTQKLISRYGRVKLQDVVKILAKNPHVPPKECERCHNKKVWHFQLNIRLCEKCMVKANKKATEAILWNPQNFSMAKRVPMQIPPIQMNKISSHRHRAW